MQRDDIVEIVEIVEIIEVETRGKLRAGQSEISREPLRHPAIEGHVAVAVPHRDELRADDGNDGPLLDVVQEVVPEPLRQVGHGRILPWKAPAGVDGRSNSLR